MVPPIGPLCCNDVRVHHGKEAAAGRSRSTSRNLLQVVVAYGLPLYTPG